MDSNNTEIIIALLLVDKDLHICNTSGNPCHWKQKSYKILICGSLVKN